MYAMAKVPLPSSLLKLKSKSAEGEAVALFKLVSPHLPVICYDIRTWLCCHGIYIHVLLSR